MLQEKYLDSIQGRIDLLNNSIQTMWSNALDNEVVKGFVNITTQLVKWVDNLGLIKTLLIGIGTYIIKKNFKGDLFGGLFGNKSKSISQIKSTMESLKKARDDAAEALVGDENNKSKQRKLNKAESTYAAYEDSMGPKIKEYNDLIEKQKVAQENLNATQREFIKATKDGVDPTTLEAYGNSVKNAKIELEGINTELKNIEIQADVTGKSGLHGWQKFKAGIDSAKTSLIQFGKEMLKSMAWAMAITAVLESFRIIGGWIGDLRNAIKPDTFEDLQEELEQTESELSNVESEIRSLNSELDDTNDRIEELMSQGSLSYVEQEELDNLKSVTKELEAQIGLKKTLQQTLQEQANGQAIEANEAYLDTSFMSDQTRTEKQEKWGETGKEIGKVTGTVAGAIFGAKVLGSIGSIGGPLGTAIGAAVGSAIFGLIGTFAGEKFAGASYDSEQTVGEAMDNMVAERAKWKAAQDEALANKDTEAYNEATEALRNYDSQMAKHISQIQANYNAMDWETATKEEKKRMIEYADWLSKYSINMGTTGAKSTAIERIFGAEADEDIQKIKDKIIESLNEGKEVNLEEMFGNTKAFDSFRSRMYDMGIYLTDVVDCFKDLKKAEDEALESDDLIAFAKGFSTITNAIDGLNKAIEEANENGIISAETITSLDEIFGSVEGVTDEWDNFVKVMMSGTASTDKMTEATRSLAEAWLDEELMNGPMTFAEKMAAAAQLTKLGVTNALSYIEDASQEAGYEALGDEIKNKLTRKQELEGIFGPLTEEQQKELSQLESDFLNLSNAEWAKKIVDDYGIADEQVEQYIGLLQEQAEYQQKLNEINDKEGQAASLQSKLNEIQENIDYYNDTLKKYEDIDMQGMLEEGLVVEDAIRQLPNDLLSSDDFVQQFEKDYRILKAKFDADGTLSDLLAEKTKLEAELDSLNINPEVTTEEKKQLKDKIANIDELIKTEFTADIQLKIDLLNASKEVDKVQSIYDTLMDAATEYNKNGYFSVDTLQSLLDLEPKYLTMLINEQGQLDLNTQAVLNVAQARLFDMTQKQIDSIITDASNAAKDGEISRLNELTDTLYEAADAQNAFNISQMTTLKQNLSNPELGLSETEQEEYYNKVQAQIDAAVAAYNNTVSHMSKALRSSGSDDDVTNGALEALQKKYERQITNLDNQQTYIQNEIDRLEAENQAVSKSYYEQQIGLEEQKLTLYKQEREALLKLDMTDEVAVALWETEHAIQESTMSMVEFRQSIIDLYKTAFDDLANAHGNKDDFLSDQQNYIDKYLELLDLQGEVASASGYQEKISTEQEKMENNVAQLDNLRELLADGMSTGYIKEGTEEWIDMQDQIREVVAAILDNKIALEEFNNELKNLVVEAFNLVRDAFSNKDNFFTTQQDYIEGYIDYLEAIGVDAPAAIYEKLIEIEQEKKNNNLADLVDARQGLKDIEAAGYTAADEEWQDAYSKVTELEKKIQDSDIVMAQWAKDIRELDFDKFDRFISRLDDVNSEIEHLRGLMDNEDVAFEDGTWTEEGITSLGLLYYQMQKNQDESQKYARQIEELNETYAEGSMSEQEYYERLQDLKEGQWDAIEAYEDIKDAIVDMEEARIDMVEKGINKEIEAYEELISLKKEELDAERDLHKFKQNIEKQNKDVNSLQRRIASLSGSTDAADIAERRKLMAELRDAQEELNDTYYDHAKDSQSKALDDEMESFQKSREDYLEALRETLDDTQAIIEEKISEFLLNADVALNTLNDTANEHNITLSDSLMKPFQNAAAESGAFKTTVGQNLQSLTNEDGVVTLFSNDAKSMIEGVFTAGGSAAALFKSTVDGEIEQIKQIVLASTSPLTGNLKFPWEGVIGEDGPINTFSKKAKSAIDNAVTKAKNNAETMKSYLSSPWTNASTAVNTFSTDVASALDANLSKMEEHVAAMNAEADKLKYPSYVGHDGSGGIDNTVTKIGVSQGMTGRKLAGITKTVDGVSYTQVDGVWYKTSDVWYDKNSKTYNVYKGSSAYSIGGSKANSQFAKHDGVVGPRRGKTYKTPDAVSKKDDVTGIYYVAWSGTGSGETRSYWVRAGSKESAQRIRAALASKNGWTPTANYDGYFKKYAKGTTSTKKDQWAITDEPQFGDELVLVPTAQGNLSYMRKGTSVVPAAITEELLKIADIGVDGLTMPKLDMGINLMSNYVNKPELNLNVEKFLSIDKVDEGCLPEVKKFVQQELDNFVRKLNYSLRGVGAR